ncbi:MAG: hypothetical protein R3E96_12410 [Planctomycetota bacterium]
MVLALSNEEDELVEEYIQSMGLTVRIAAGADGGNMTWSSIPHTFLVGADGKILWHGSPYGLSNGIIEDALRGVKKSSNSVLAYNSATEFKEGAVTSIADMARQAQLAKSIQAVGKLLEKASGAEAEEAKVLQGELDGFVEMLQAQAESFITKREMVIGTDLLAEVAKECKGLPVADKIAARLKEIDDDKELSNELAADRELAKLREAASKKSWKRQLKKLEKITERYEGTGAAKRAAKIIRSINAE